MDDYDLQIQSCFFSLEVGERRLLVRGKSRKEDLGFGCTGGSVAEKMEFGVIAQPLLRGDLLDVKLQEKGGISIAWMRI